MYRTSLILTILLASLGFASPLTLTRGSKEVEALQVRDDTVERQWTISEVSRQRSDNNTLCKWHIHLSDTTTPTPSPSPSLSLSSLPSPTPLITPTFAAFTCDFEISVPEGQDCGMLEFSAPICSGNSSGSSGNKKPSSFTVNGGHSELGFVVMVVQDEDEDLRAYFGFDDWALDDGFEIPPQTSSVMSSSSSSGSEVAAARSDDHVLMTAAKKRDVSDSAPAPVPAPVPAPADDHDMITVRDMSRRIDLVFNTVNLSFKIHKAANKTTGDDDDDDDDIPCNVVVEAYQGTNLETWQWYDRQCTGSEYWVSWGYMADSDAGIMTLVSPTRDTEAFFGFTNISKSNMLGQSGPSPVWPCNCGFKPAN